MFRRGLICMLVRGFMLTENKNKLPEVVLRCACGAVLYGDPSEVIPAIVSQCPFCASDLITKGRMN